MNFYEFYQLLEDFRDIDPENERQTASRMGMTAGLPVGSPLDMLHDLTRAFHLNTIVGRMFQVWTNSFQYAPVHWEYQETAPEKVYQYCISRTDWRANDRYKAAYDLFKQEIANAVAALPYKEGKDIRTGKYQDVMAATKQFLSKIETEERDLIQSMRNAYRIYWTVFGHPYRQHIRDFRNFFEIVKEEFMKLSEQLPTMGEDEGEIADTPYVQALDAEIAYYTRLEEEADSAG